VLQADGVHTGTCVELSVLVEDDWQQRGIGTELITHLAGVAHSAGFLELITYPATAMHVAQHLMIDVGRTRVVPDVEAHLHTFLPETASLGLGAVRQRLAG
jgi:GNAT superfamily N-acetyltransferase